MGGRGSGSKMAPQTFQMQVNPPTLVASAAQAQQANNSAFSDTDSSPFHDLYGGRAYFQKQNLTADQINATIQYLRDDTEAGTLYSMSQNLNHELATAAEQGRAPNLNANQRYTYKHLMAAMHNLGYNVNLTRYDHADMVNNLLKKAGAKNPDFTKMTDKQLAQALKGTQFGEERFVSTSYTNFKNAPASSKGVFMNRAVRIEYRAKANTQVLMPGNGPGGRLDEIILKPSGGRNNMKITDVHYDHGVKVRQKGTNYLSNQSQLVVVVEVG